MWIIWPPLIAFALMEIMTIALMDIPGDTIMFIWFSLIAFISLITSPSVDFATSHVSTAWSELRAETSFTTGDEPLTDNPCKCTLSTS